MIGRLLVLVATSALSLGAAYALRDWFRSARLPTRVDRRDLDVPDGRPALALFTSPYCHECQVALPILRQASQAHDTNLVVIDARQRPDLLAKYAIRATPTILVVDGTGGVTAGWHTSPSEQQLAAAVGVLVEA